MCFQYWTVIQIHWKSVTSRSALIYTAICFSVFVLRDGSVFCKVPGKKARARIFISSFRWNCFGKVSARGGKSRVAKFSLIHTRFIHPNVRHESARTSWPVAWAGIPASLPLMTYVHQNSPYMGFASAGKKEADVGTSSTWTLKPQKFRMKAFLSVLEMNSPNSGIIFNAFT